MSAIIWALGYYLPISSMIAQTNGYTSPTQYLVDEADVGHWRVEMCDGGYMVVLIK